MLAMLRHRSQLQRAELRYQRHASIAIDAHLNLNVQMIEVRVHFLPTWQRLQWRSNSRRRRRSVRKIYVKLFTLCINTHTGRLILKDAYITFCVHQRKHIPATLVGRTLSQWVSRSATPRKLTAFAASTARRRDAVTADQPYAANTATAAHLPCVHMHVVRAHIGDSNATRSRLYESEAHSCVP